MKTKRRNSATAASRRKGDSRIVSPKKSPKRQSVATDPQLRFTFNKRKAAQAAAYIVSLAGGRLNKGHLIKMLYAADRRQLRRVGEPITGDAACSMPCGPILSRILNLLNGSSADAYWEKHLTTATKSIYNIYLKEPASTDLLTENELDSLRRAHEFFKDFSWEQLKDWVHQNFKEWEDPDGSSIPITYESMLKASGRKQSYVRELKGQQQEAQLLSAIFG